MMGRGGGLFVRAILGLSCEEVGFFFLSLRHRLVVLRLEDGGLLQRRKLLDLVDEYGAMRLPRARILLTRANSLDIDLGRA